MKRFEDRVALITGAATGIGRASALRLADEGARLVCCDIETEALEETVKMAREAGAEVEGLECDVSDPGAVESAVAATVERFGQLHVVANVAGILHFEHTHEYPLESWDRILAVNLTGTFLICRAAIPHLLETRGNIVNISSIAALAGHPWTAAYSASKGGVLALTRGIAVEYGKQGLRANAICPGSVTTKIADAFRVPEGADPKLVRRIMPLDEFRGPEVVASTLAFVASDDGAHINGATLRVDGATLS